MQWITSLVQIYVKISKTITPRRYIFFYLIQCELAVK